LDDGAQGITAQAVSSVGDLPHRAERNLPVTTVIANS